MSARKKDGSTVLHLASLNGHVNLRWMLIERGADAPHQQLTMPTTDDADYRPQRPRGSGGGGDDASDNNDNH
jgi:ankyrin repeat protein